MGRSAGVTLFEVVLALAIFIGSFAAISQILRTGSLAAIRSQLASEAAQRCESRLNDVVAGVLPPQSVSRSAFEDDSNWLWTVNVVSGALTDTLQVEVVVEHQRGDGQINAAFRAVRLMRDPQVFVEASTIEMEGSSF